MKHKVTALKVQKRNPNRVNVYLDGEFSFGAARIVAAWLQVGQELDDEQIAQLNAQDTDEVAFQKALHFAGYRPRTEAEVQKKLEEEGVSAEAIAQIILRLREDGYLNDLRFAQGWVESRSNFRPRSHRLMAMEMKQRGLDETAIEQALEVTAGDEELAYQAGSRKARQLSQADHETFRNRLTQFLARRGFSYGVIVPTVQRLWQEVGLSTSLLTNDMDELKEDESWNP